MVTWSLPELRRKRLDRKITINRPVTGQSLLCKLGPAEWTGPGIHMPSNKQQKSLLSIIQ